jgi:hypothetical protein
VKGAEHTQYIDQATGTPKVASKPQDVVDAIRDANPANGQGDRTPDEQQRLVAAVAKATAAEATLARLAASAQQGNEPANQQIPAQQSILANVLATMWEAALPLDADKLQARFKALRDIADAEMEINKARTQALTARVFKNPTYLHQGRLVIGAGFAAVQNVATLPDRSNVIGVGFPELWYQHPTSSTSLVS